jgi:hypothetical protein
MGDGISRWDERWDERMGESGAGEARPELRCGAVSFTGFAHDYTTTPRITNIPNSIPSSTPI